MSIKRNTRTKKRIKESKEYIDIDKKDKDKVMKEFNKLYNEKYIYRRKTNNRTRISKT